MLATYKYWHPCFWCRSKIRINLPELVKLFYMSNIRKSCAYTLMDIEYKWIIVVNLSSFIGQLVNPLEGKGMG